MPPFNRSRSALGAVTVAAAVLAWSGNSHAQHVDTAETTSGPNMGLVTSGIVMFGLSYGTSAVIASTSDRDEDDNLYVPLAGPWMNLADRPDCGNECGTETAYKIALVADGIFQAAGALQIIGGLFIWPRERSTRSSPSTVIVTKDKARQEVAKPTIRIATTTLGYQSFGLAARRTF